MERAMAWRAFRSTAMTMVADATAESPDGSGPSGPEWRQMPQNKRHLGPLVCLLTPLRGPGPMWRATHPAPADITGRHRASQGEARALQAVRAPAPRNPKMDSR
ncbi:hypothetical protein GCM10017557_59210 [Streptomyces aurantiacus]|uniref:Uncharacterized protein n=1 Tax=Streptomyces aurantiacus TaxID=47760 RepID=A0A7G1P7Q5_9ACTN|nr:hypothetical protein GCM10017557_59210 [Streptomyces aurantiacus]